MLAPGVGPPGAQSVQQGRTFSETPLRGTGGHGVPAKKRRENTSVTMNSVTFRHRSSSIRYAIHPV